MNISGEKYIVRNRQFNFTIALVNGKLVTENSDI